MVGKDKRVTGLFPSILVEQVLTTLPKLTPSFNASTLLPGVLRLQVFTTCAAKKTFINKKNYKVKVLGGKQEECKILKI